MFPPSTNNSRAEKSRTRAIFGQTGKRKAELKGQALDPTCPAARVGPVSLCTEVLAHRQTPGPRPPVAGRKSGHDRQAGGSSEDAAWVRRPSLVLNQSLHLVHEVPGQLQDLLGVVSLGHFVKELDDVCEIHVVLQDDVTVDLHQSQRDEQDVVSG